MDIRGNINFTDSANLIKLGELCANLHVKYQRAKINIFTTNASAVYINFSSINIKITYTSAAQSIPPLTT